MNQQLLGETTAKLMDSLGDDSRLDGGEIIAVGIVAIVQVDDMTYTRTMSNEDIHHRALGLFREGFLTIERGHTPDSVEDDE